MTVTQKEIARRLGVSRELVAHALRGRPGVADETRERIVGLAEELGYRPNPIARQLRGGRSGVLGVLIGHDNPQVNFDRLAHLDEEAYRHGYRLMVGHVHDDVHRAKAYLHDFTDRGVDGVIWMDQPATPHPTLDDNTLDRVPHLIALHDPRIKATHRIHIDYADGIRQAVHHLRERGKQRIALALAAAGWEGNPMTERRRGYAEALEELGLPDDDALVWIGTALNAEPADHAAEIVEALVKRGRADAVLASNDIWAVELIKELRRRGLRVPDDAAVVGFDNLSLAERFDPPLTTLDQRHDAFAQAVIAMLRTLAKGAPETGTTHREVVAPRLVIRKTS